MRESISGLKTCVKAVLVLVLALFQAAPTAFAFTANSKAERSYREEKYDDALEFYDKALEKKPADPDLGYNRAVVLYRKGEFEPSEEAFVYSAVSGGKTLEADATYNTGNAKYRIGETLEVGNNVQGAIHKYKEALDYYKRAIELDPADPDPKYNHEFLSEKIEKLMEEQPKQPQQDQKDQE